MGQGSPIRLFAGCVAALLIGCAMPDVPPRERIRAGFGKPETTLKSSLSIPEQRAAWEEFVARESSLPDGVAVRDLEEISATLVEPAGATSGLIIHAHGGGFVMGSPKTHWPLAAQLALASHSRVLLIDYRLAPEHQFPAARDDAIAAYRWALAQGYSPQRIVMSGDSAGGHVALSAVLELRSMKLPLPAAMVLLSPWLDLAQRGESMRTRAAMDPNILEEDLKDCAKMYLGARSPLDPAVNLLDENLDGLPPLLVHVGDEEILLDDSTRLVERVRGAGGSVEITVWPRLWHVFHAYAPELPEANEAIARIGKFVERHVQP